jgi:uncharacterized protein YfdQ (DUF2303 family)
VSENQGTETKAAVDAGLAAAEPTPLNPDSTNRAVAWVVPEGASLTMESLEWLRNEPWRKRGVVKHRTATSLMDYVDTHAEPGTAVWVSEAQIVAVVDDHWEGGAGWADHRAVMPLQRTPEWQHWMKLDGQLVSQQAFAEHIEEGLTEIVEPAAADMLEVAQSFQAHTEAAFRSGTRLHSGETRLLYDEETTASAGKTGELTVPTTFTLGISPFEGEDPYRVTARLRYRVTGGTLRIGYKLDRPHVVIREAVQAIHQSLVEHFGGQAEVDVYLGEPRGVTTPLF